MQQRRLTRSHDHMIAGVCGGIAEYLGWSPSSTRLAYFLVSFLSAAFPGLLIYIALWIAMPPPPPRGFEMEDFRER